MCLTLMLHGSDFVQTNIQITSDGCLGTLRSYPDNWWDVGLSIATIAVKDMRPPSLESCDSESLLCRSVALLLARWSCLGKRVGHGSSSEML